MNIQLLAFLLLVGRIIAITFNVLVIKRQRKIRKIPTHPRLLNIRRVLALLATLVFIGNIYPFVLDAVTLFDPAVRTAQTVKVSGALYAISTNLTFLCASILIWALYKLADIAIEVGELIAGDPPTPVALKPKK